MTETNVTSSTKRRRMRDARKHEALHAIKRKQNTQPTTTTTPPPLPTSRMSVSHYARIVVPCAVSSRATAEAALAPTPSIKRTVAVNADFDSQSRVVLMRFYFVVVGFVVADYCAANANALVVDIDVREVARSEYRDTSARL